MALVDAMWNHAATMREEFARRKLAWSELTPQELADMLVYLRNLPAERAAPPASKFPPAATARRCSNPKDARPVTPGKLDLGSRLKNKTLTDIAVEMWNHEPRMTPNPPQLSLEEMRDLVSYLWAGEFFKDSGSPSAGGRLFTSKHCATCHNDASSGAPFSPVPANLSPRPQWSPRYGITGQHARSNAGERHPVATFRPAGDVGCNRLPGREEWRKVEMPVRQNRPILLLLTRHCDQQVGRCARHAGWDLLAVRLTVKLSRVCR